MARRSSRTPLYEYMATGRPPGASPPERSERRGADDRIDADNRTLRRTIRIPAGYILVGATGVILLLVLAYTVGFKRADDALRAEYEERFLDEAVQVDASRRARDPLSADKLAQRVSEPAVDQEGDIEIPGGGSASRWGPVESDPRQAGLSYFVLATTSRDGARRLAEFCRSRGLESYVISGNNPSYRRVIAAPGFSRSTDAAVSRLRDKILDIGREWKGRFPGESDLSDSYLLKTSRKK